MTDTANAAPRQNCRYCGFTHQTICPRIAAIEYHPDGTTKRVEFVQPKIGGLANVVRSEAYWRAHADQTTIVHKDGSFDGPAPLTMGRSISGGY